jgi:cysteinyl-tRNA synthetase
VAEKIEELFAILGVNLQPEISREEEEMADLLLELREDAREKSDYDTADDIREKLGELGFKVEDSKKGPIWLK